jgi:hypothetical protein
MTKEERERRMILENQAAIMTALIAVLKGALRSGTNTAVTDLYYHAAKTTAYIGPPQ